MEEFLKNAIKTSINAGLIILKLYNSDETSFYKKDDSSPLTLADKLSHDYIFSKLKKTQLPILSEEDEKILPSKRIYWDRFWLIDPLDGTKEFIKKNGEFTVNIALIEKDTPVLGVVYSPVTKELYYSTKKIGSFKFENISKFNDLKNNNCIDLSKLELPKKYTIVVSRSHLNEATLEFIDKTKVNFEEIKCMKFGSSLKICKVAERKAHCYPRLGPTMEWDTAAAHAIAKYSGKNILNFYTKKEIKYNKKSLYNPFFVVQ